MPQSKFMDAHDAAYLAGLLDGEGYFSITERDKPSRGYHYRRWEIRICVCTTTREFMEEVAAMVPWGGGTVGPTARHLKGRAKPAWRMTWHGGSAIELCRAIQPFIRLKRRHVELILAIDAAKTLAQPERSGQGHAYPLWITHMLESAAAEFKVLNTRGQDNAIEERAPA